MSLTSDQEIALKGILEFISRPIQKYEDCATILYAAAGCGKTYLTRFIADKLRGNYTIAGVAPTHKARKVLEHFLNKDSFCRIQTMTVASLLSKMRSHSYIGTKNYTSGAGSKIALYNFFIIDEASMITDKDIKTLITYAFEYKRKMLFVGDKYQIPNPSQNYICENGIAYKADAIVFNIPGFELTTNLRQKEGNPIVPIYWEMRNAIAEKRDPVIEKMNKMENNLGVKFYREKEEWYGAITETYIQPDINISELRIIAYTNDAVKSHNFTIRTLFARGIFPEVGELLMGYNNVGFPEPYVCNGQDYYILDVSQTKHYRILDFPNLVGMVIQIKEVDTEVAAKLFVPDIGERKNNAILQELAKRAEKVNSTYSSKLDFKKYHELRNKLIFMENIYKFKNEIIAESSFRNIHPLLFKAMSDVIDYDSKRVLENKLSDDISDKYGDILLERLRDNKNLSDTEKICDSFCIIEKDIDYGYSITSHKSQGSTYKTVFIDEADFDKLQDHYNYKLGCEIKSSKEKNQLRYVAYTRPTDSAHIFYRD